MGPLAVRPDPRLYRPQSTLRFDELRHSGRTLGVDGHRRTVRDLDLGDDAESPLLPRQVRRATRRFVAGVRRSAPSFQRLNPSMILVDSGSVARDHLASERTFLVYVRTSLGIAPMGVGASSLPVLGSGPRAKLSSRRRG